MVQDELMNEEGMGGFSPTPIIAAALAAGVAAFIIRRARQEEERTPVTVAASAWERAQDPKFRQKTADATRDWLMDRIIPELKPILLDLLEGFQDIVEQGFKKAEKTIKDL